MSSEKCNWYATDYFSGIIRANYYYDFTDWNYANDYQRFSNAVDDVLTKYNGSTSDAGTLTDYSPDLASYITKMAQVYFVVLSYYNEIYLSKGSFPYDFVFNDNHYEFSFVEDILQKSGGDDALKDFMKLPEIIAEGDDVYIKMYVNYDTHAANLDRAYLLNSLFADETGILHSSDGVKKTIDPLQVELKETILHYIFLANDGFKVLEDTEDSFKNKFDTTDCMYTLTTPQNLYNYPFVVYYSYKCKITKWSPMLWIYMKYNFKETVITDAICKKFLLDTSIFPLDYFKCPSPATFTNPCIKNIQDYCDMDYVPPTYVTAGQSFVSDAFLVKMGEQCLCYTKSVVAPGAGTYEKQPNMCFSTYCTDSNWVNAFNLSNDDCKSQCEVVWKWIQNNQVQGAYLDRFNTQKYEEVCGRTFTPYEQESFNIGICCGVLIFTACIATATGLSIKKKGTIAATTSLITAIGIGVSIFLGLDLAGQFGCKDTSKLPTDSVCTSKLSGISLPSQFCSTMVQCQCAFNQDCPTSCTCLSGSCWGPGSTLDTVNCKEVNYDNLVPLTACAIGLPPALMLICKHFKVLPKIYAPVAVVVAIIFTIPAIITGIVRQESSTLSGECNLSSSSTTASSSTK